MLYPLDRAALLGQPSHVTSSTFYDALFTIHKLWAMSFIVGLIADISKRTGPKFLACSRMLLDASVYSCSTRSRSLFATVTLPCYRGPRHGHDPVDSTFS